MNKKALVNEILDLYDTIENLKNEFMGYYKKQVDDKKMEIVRSKKDENN